MLRLALFTLLFALALRQPIASKIPTLSALQSAQSALWKSQQRDTCRATRRTEINTARAAVKMAKKCLRERLQSNCPDLSVLKAAVAATKARTCPKGLGRTKLNKNRLDRIIERRRKLLGVPNPAYKLTVIEPEGGIPDAAIIVLNGLGEQVADILPLVLATKQAMRNQKVRIIIPQAPEIFVDEAQAIIPAWYNVVPGKVPDKVEVLDAVSNVEAIADMQRKVFGIDPARVLLFGVSQGTGVANTAYLRHQYGGLVSTAGFLLFPEDYPAKVNEASKDAPILIFHGSADTRVPVRFGRMTRDALLALGRTVTYVEFEGGMHRLTAFSQQIVGRTANFYDSVLQ